MHSVKAMAQRSKKPSRQAAILEPKFLKNVERAGWSSDNNLV
jgi:hypothetical protein